jgi:hypothetical protein
MSVIVDIVNAIVDFSDQVQSFFADGIYDLLSQWTAWFIEWAVVAMWKVKLAVLAFSWDVAQNIIADLNISAFLNQAWGALNSQTLSMLFFFRVPEAVNIIVSAGVTKLVFRFVGF